MKKVFRVIFCVGLLLGSQPLFAQEKQISDKQASIERLRIEYRLRVQAQSLVSDLSLFDETGLLGRGVQGAQVLDTQENNTLGPDVGRFPDPSSPSSSALVEVSAGKEMSFDAVGLANLGDPSLLEILKEIEVISQQEAKGK